MKKAFIDQILLGFVLFSAVLILVATISDNTSVRNKYNNLKDITNNAALFAAKHFNINQSTTNAETASKNSISQTKLGAEVVNSISFTWDLVNEPKSVIARIDNYDEKLFWDKLLSLNSFNLGAIESKAVILPLTQSGNFAPIAINQCNRPEFQIGDEQKFEFHSYTEFSNSDLKAFYAVTDKCENPSGNSFFADYKNIYNNPSFDERDNFESDYGIDVESDKLCLPETDFENPDTVDPKQFYDKFKNFPVGSRLQIALLDCNSTAANINTKELITVEITAAPTCTQGTWTNTEEDWDEREWNEERSTCNGGNYDYKLLDLDLKVVDKNRIILEY